MFPPCSPSGPGEKPSDVCSARRGGGLKGADQGAVREELCVGEGERRAEISGQQRAAVSAVHPVDQQLGRRGFPTRTQPASAASPAAASSSASVAVAPPASAPPPTPAAPDSAAARSQPTTATQRHLCLKAHQKPTKEKQNSIFSTTYYN